RQGERVEYVPIGCERDEPCSKAHHPRGRAEQTQRGCGEDRRWLAVLRQVPGVVRGVRRPACRVAEHRGEEYEPCQPVVTAGGGGVCAWPAPMEDQDDRDDG